MAKQPEKNQDKIDVLYQWLSYELQQARDTLLTEVRMSSAQIGSLYGELKSESEQSMKAVSQEIRYSYKQNQTIYDGLASMLTQEVGERLNSMDEKLAVTAEIETLLNEISEIKYSYMQLQGICGALSDSVANEVNPKLDVIAEKQALLKQLEEAINALSVKLEELRLSEEDYKKLADTIAEKTEETVASHSEQVIEAVKAIPEAENVDYSRIVEEVGDKVLEIINQIKSEEVVPVAEVVEPEKIDYDRIIYGAAEKVVESMPAPEKVDYDRIESAIPALDMDAIAEAVAAKFDMDAIAEVVASKIVLPEVPAAPEVDYERLADLAASKIVVPEAPAAPEIDYERLADMVAARIVVPAAPEAPAAPEVDYERLADLVIEKMTSGTEQTCEVVLDDAGIEEIAAKVVDKLPTPETIDYDKVCQAAQAAQILPDPVDYDRIAEIVEDKLSSDESTYDLVIDEEGLNAIAKGVSEEICQMCATCEVVCEETVEEAEVVEAAPETVEEAPVVEEAEVVEEVAEEAPAVEEVVEEATEVVEEPVEEATEVVEEPVEEAPVVEETPEETVEEVSEVVEETSNFPEGGAEEIVEEASAVESAADVPVEEELATAVVPSFDELGNELVDAETGLVIRLKRSFTAKMKQSEEKVKGYYSDIKNELTSYKKINSNVSWHGDRFNYGRDTVAKININGKTLCFYVALDPNDPELKTTVYHQKDVSAQKAYENTPFMVKIKSDVAVKKALRLVGFLAEKLGTEKEEDFQEVDYVEEFAYQSTKQLFDEGFIKATKEKKVDFDF